MVAVESEGFSADDLKTNLENKGHRVVRSQTLDFLRSQAQGQEKPDLVLADPPRAGLGKEICAHLAGVAAPELVYVSCDPATLARDLQLLLQSGYAVEKMDLIDLFPQTFHMETVTLPKAELMCCRAGILWDDASLSYRQLRNVKGRRLWGFAHHFRPTYALAKWGSRHPGGTIDEGTSLCIRRR